MSAVRVARRYAAALLMLGKQMQVEDRLAEDARLILTVGQQSPEFRNLLKSPIVYRDKKGRILQRLFEGKVHEVTFRFIRIVLRKRREAYLLEAFRQFIELYKAAKKIADVMVILPLEGDARLMRLLEEWLRTLPALQDKQHLAMQAVTDERLLGGVVVEFEGYKLDRSVRTQLEKFKQAFSFS